MREQKQRHGGGGTDIDNDENSSVGVEILDPTAALKEAKAAIKKAEKVIEKNKEERRREESGCGCW